jgi:PAS domain S-box-containing protein
MWEKSISIDKTRARFYLLLFSVIVCVDIAIYIGFMGAGETAYLHFFYVPILLAGIWFRWRAVYAGFFLAAIYIFVLFYSFNVAITWFSLTQVIMLILVSSVIGAVSEMRAKAEENLKKEKLFSENVINTVPDSLIVVDNNLRLKTANQTFYNTFKITPDEVRGKTIADILQDTEGKLSVELKKIFDTETQMENFEKHYQSEQIGEKIFSTRAKALVDSADKGVVVVQDITKRKKAQDGLVVFEDITERKLAEKTLETYRDHLKLINRILRHDLLNDLTVINSALNLYKNSREEAVLEEASRRILKSADLIRRMKELETLMSSVPVLKSCNARERFEKVAQNYQVVNFNIAGDCRILADDAFDSVIENIITNAVVHGKTDTIEVILKEKDDLCEMRIADHGIGIPDEIKGRIFEENFRYGETGKTGLGLYIVKRTTERYGGAVSVENNVPKGTVFILKLKKAS